MSCTRLERQPISLMGYIAFLNPQKSAGVIDIFDKITFKAGFTTVYVHGTSPDEVAFVRSFAENTSIFYLAVENYFATSSNTIFSSCPRERCCSAALTMRYR